MLCQKRLADFRSKVAEINTKRITACRLDVLKCLHHMNFALNDTDRTLIHALRAILLCISLHQCLSSVYGQRFGKAVTAHRHNAHFHLR